MMRFGLGLAIALLVLPGSVSIAETAKPAAKAQPGIAPPLPEPKPDQAAAKAPPPPDVWMPAEIEAAKARCTAALKGLNVLVSYEEPIKDGECGDPAPIRLVKLDNVTFSPAALINCGMLAPLHTWITQDLQMSARRHLGHRIAQIEVMSDYSCRTAFGRVGKKLSEHAYVDALDIRGFVTDKGQKLLVLESWGPNNRDIAAAKAREAKLAEAAAASKVAQPGSAAAPSPGQAATGTRTAAGTPGNILLKPTRTDDIVTVILPGGIKRQQVAARLGGPVDRGPADERSKAQQGKVGQQVAALGPLNLPTPATNPQARFLREAHDAACRIFGTTLGPEANEAHRNHFHVDMAERKIKKICD